MAYNYGRRVLRKGGSRIALFTLRQKGSHWEELQREPVRQKPRNCFIMRPRLQGAKGQGGRPEGKAGGSGQGRGRGVRGGGEGREAEDREQVAL